MNLNNSVTVVIPCFNDGKYIIEALDSILNQTIKAEKIIIIDDGSGIETRKVLEGIKYDTVEIILQDNKGVCKTRNKGISLAKTEYILNLDADDYFHPTFIEKAVSILNKNPKIGVVGCYYKVLKGNKLETNIKKPLGGGVKNFLVKNNGLGTSMFRKICWEEVSGYDENMVKGYEDWDFWISLLRNGWEMHIIKEPLFTYRIKKISRDINALKKHDMELRIYIFNKHKQAYLDNFDSFTKQTLYLNHQLRLTKLKCENALDFKLGKAILAPIRFFKKKISK